MVAEMKKLEGLAKKIEQYESHLKIVQGQSVAAAATRDTARDENKAFRDDSEKRKSEADRHCEAAKAQILEERNALQAEKDRLAEDRRTFANEQNGLASKVMEIEMERRKLSVDRSRVDAYFNEIKKLSAGW